MYRAKGIMSLLFRGFNLASLNPVFARCKQIIRVEADDTRFLFADYVKA